MACVSGPPLDPYGTCIMSPEWNYITNVLFREPFLSLLSRGIANPCLIDPDTILNLFFGFGYGVFSAMRLA